MNAGPAAAVTTPTEPAAAVAAAAAAAHSGGRRSAPSTPRPYSTPMCFDAPSTPAKNFFASLMNVREVSSESEPAWCCGPMRCTAQHSANHRENRRSASETTPLLCLSNMACSSSPDVTPHGHVTVIRLAAALGELTASSLQYSTAVLHFTVMNALPPPTPQTHASLHSP